ncbi:hypothetical protein SAMN04487974_13021 [Pelagibacterium luteolum]|uniref:Uncharacterized protein n=1 Tax=Pelagibacterium luteolum TaxID=440168 RepID=A0A1G8AHK5_9HYPH|nr:hypothetical protein SAMN04487974_13021 [Pelagibacterium luteolum]
MPIVRSSSLPIAPTSRTRSKPLPASKPESHRAGEIGPCLVCDIQGPLGQRRAVQFLVASGAPRADPQPVVRAFDDYRRRTVRHLRDGAGPRVRKCYRRRRRARFRKIEKMSAFLARLRLPQAAQFCRVSSEQPGLRRLSGNGAVGAAVGRLRSLYWHRAWSRNLTCKTTQPTPWRAGWHFWPETDHLGCECFQ